MSSWGLKLEKKLKALADGASKESLQTLATWVCFNRKHATVFAKTFCDALLQTTSEARQLLYWQVLNEALLANREDVGKWERTAELRTTLGEAAIIPALEGLGTRALTDKIEGLWKQWDEHTVFGGPTMIGQIRRQLAATRSASPTKEEDTESTSPSAAANETSPPTETPAAPAAPETQENSASVEVEKKEEKMEEDAISKRGETSASADRRGSLSSIGSGKQRRSSLSSQPGLEVEYDFESKDIPFGAVDSREFLDPCRAVATLQIARDVRNDTPVQLNSMLSNLPKDISDKVDSIANDETKVEDLDKATIRDYSIRIPAKLLELDLEEQYQNIKTFQDIIQQQKTARQKLIRLLIKSRCRFGAEEAAKQFFELKETSQKLKKRKQLLVDALELEGLDAELDTTDFEKTLDDLAPLSWYNPDENGGDAKRQRIESDKASAL